MEHVLVVAIIRRAVLRTVENKLHEIGVRGFTKMAVQGRGDMVQAGHDVLAQDFLEDEAKIELYLSRDMAKQVVDLVLDAACTSLQGDGILAVLPVECVVSVRTLAEAIHG